MKKKAGDIKNIESENTLENEIESSDDSEVVNSGNNSEKAEFPKMLTVESSPHIKSTEKTGTIMLQVIIALIPALVWGCFVFGLRVLCITLVSVAACVLFEAAFQILLKRKVTIKDCSAALTGVLLAMNLPVSVPLWMVAAGAFFAIVIVKQLFGGIGKNIVNPALAARIFLFAWPAQMGVFTEAGKRISDFHITVDTADAIAGATPLAVMKTGVLPTASLFDLIIGNIAGCIGEVSSVLIIIGGVYLIFTKIISWRIPVAYIGTVMLLTFIFPRAGDGFEFMLYQVFSGGLLLGAFFMATDYVTSPVTPRGRLIYGAGCGILTVFIRYFGGYVEGVSFAILIMNLLVHYIEKITLPPIFGSKAHNDSK